MSRYAPSARHENLRIIEWHCWLKIQYQTNYTRLRACQRFPWPTGPTGLVHAPAYYRLRGLWCRTNESDISGYRKLLLEQGSPEQDYKGTVTAGYGLQFADIEEFATDAGELDGLHTGGAKQSYITLWSWWGPVSENNPDSVQIRWFLYHRTSGGSETLVKTGFFTVTTTPSSYQTNWTMPEQCFGKDERFVLKFRGRFYKQPPE